MKFVTFLENKRKKVGLVVQDSIYDIEKITFFNQKAELFRVHNRLYQISEEIKERGHGICQEPSDFLKELFNQC